MNCSFSSFFSCLLLCCCMTFIFLRYFSLYMTSYCFSTSSYLKNFSSLFRPRNTWRFLSSSPFCSVYIILPISLSLLTSSRFSSRYLSAFNFNKLLTWACVSLKSLILSFRAFVRRSLSSLNAYFSSFLVSNKEIYYGLPLVDLFCISRSKRRESCLVWQEIATCCFWSLRVLKI